MLTSLPNKGARGFTLIELLIVIAIILILIAIALPNFLEAQVRAKVTKERTDLRTLATGLESYRIDFGGYPMDHDSAWPLCERNTQYGYKQLTSPIPYLTELPRDPLGQEMATGDASCAGAARNSSFYYEGGSGSDQTPNCGPSRLGVYFQNNNWSSANCVHSYLLLGLGPDKDDSCSGNDDFPYNTVLNVYSPTNGTKSFGDVYKTVGEFRRAPSINPPAPGVRRQAGAVLVPYQQEGE